MLTKLHKYKKYSVIILLGFMMQVLGSTALNAQDLDLHFSQFQLAPLQYNPALTGIFDADYRFSGLYRRQWQNVPVDYQTLGAAMDTRLPLKTDIPGIFSVGGLLNYDEAGDAQLRYTELAVMSSYAHPVGDQNWISLGIQAGYIQRRFSDAQLKWDRQFDGELYRPGLSPQEEFRATQTSFFDFSTGLNWHLRTSERMYFNLGSGIRHLTQPFVNFIDEAPKKWAMRYNAYIMANMPLTAQLDARFYGLTQFQGPAREWLASGGILYHFTDQSPYKMALGINLGWRAGDAFIPSVEFRYGPWTAGISYDINTSEFTKATNGQGGPEIMLVYLISSVKPPTTFKSCPVF
jgi:type IX secretion system PorP/SprF family membrane protein